jgi:hypothetical protein
VEAFEDFVDRLFSFLVHLFGRFPVGESDDPFSVRFYDLTVAFSVSIMLLVRSNLTATVLADSQMGVLGASPAWIRLS